ncbi:hypothetical protein BB558_000057 [Smittium angustum]|uniref:Uncharacterized protein n=1 Tax=Smittium angustum TaxID=133377 RepID=A0A2U1JF76_SMIAN|nr:hypothetical protein BB558_000057 [Smittium angustum]
MKQSKSLNNQREYLKDNLMEDTKDKVSKKTRNSHKTKPLDSSKVHKMSKKELSETNRKHHDSLITKNILLFTLFVLKTTRNDLFCSKTSHFKYKLETKQKAMSDIGLKYCYGILNSSCLPIGVFRCLYNFSDIESIYQNTIGCKYEQTIKDSEWHILECNGRVPLLISDFETNSIKEKNRRKSSLKLKMDHLKLKMFGDSKLKGQNETEEKITKVKEKLKNTSISQNTYFSFVQQNKPKIQLIAKIKSKLSN